MKFKGKLNSYECGQMGRIIRKNEKKLKLVFCAEIICQVVWRCVMLQIETPEVLNGCLVFSEHVMMNKRNVGCVYEPRKLA
jgi:hypothetical protein